MKRIVQMTSVHPRYDTRIFHKMCTSLSKKYEVNLIVADGKGNEIKDDVKIFDVGKPLSRKQRFLKIRKKILSKAIELNGEIYHFHDPELIPIGLKLKKMGKKVIYDVHEDVPRQILNKPYLNRLLKPVISKIFEKYENRSARKFDYVITATPFINERFRKLNPNSTDINNFPLLSELFQDTLWENRKPEICYIGGIYRVRGIEEIVTALEYVDTTLHLAGNFESENLKKELKQTASWKKVIYYGFLDRAQIKKLLSEVKIGLVTFHPIHNHIHSQPNKMFEYMSAGIPVIASNFPLWQEIIEGNRCGICVDPLNPQEIAKAIDYLLKNDNVAKEMGEHGRRAIEEKYNWENERKKLLNIYIKLLSNLEIE